MKLTGLVVMEHRFIGRNRELEQLRQLWNGNQHKIFGLYGHKSVGKTRLLKKFISELKEKNQDLKVLEFDFHEIKTYKRFLKLFSKSFQIEWDQNDSEKDENEITDDIYELVDKVLEEIKKNYSESKACVFVLNNLENAMPKANRDGTDPDVLDKSLWDNIWEDIFKKLIPNSYLYIDSTRHAKFARYGNAAELIDVEPLEDDDALEASQRSCW
ncbi:hypothetical protein KUTeg_007118 [Tegillarca granosa]|uniref:ATPase domain-containing protein n=1 Tax=Tegillarca granosa TaxID=220873 RepID=A0ABQ9FGZ8_TEGGR|nr:hypothetical protein KUTeg_007118 [Tegillarca granosa]